MNENFDSNYLKIPNFIQKINLNEYICNEANVDIYNNLKNLYLADDSILEYFNNLYHEFYIILENLGNPIELINHIQRLDLDKEELFFNLQDLIIVITNSNEYSQQYFRERFHIILDFIVDMIFELGEELYPEVYGDGVERNFRRIVSYSNSDVDNQTQLKKLLNIRTSLQQNEILYGSDGKNEKLIRILNLEISRIEKLFKYSSEKNENNSTTPNKDVLIFEDISSDSKVINQEESELENAYQARENNKPELSLKQIALIYIYSDLSITRENGNIIAEKFGYKSRNSGEKLYQYFTQFYNIADRKGTEDTKLKTKNKIKLIESIIESLPKGKQNKATDEVSILNTLCNNTFQ